MKVFYYCQTGKYAALLAGAYHLKKLDQKASYQKFLAYVAKEKVKPYKPYFLGVDQLGTEVYVIGTKTEAKLVATIVKSFSDTFSKKNENIQVLDSLAQPNLLLLLLLKLSTVGIFNFVTEKVLPYAIWTNRYHIYSKTLESTLT